MDKKSLLISIIVIVLIAAAYYFIFMKNAEPIVWDGSYKMTGNLKCTGNFPNLTEIPMDTIITVSDNKIVDEQADKSFAIKQSWLYPLVKKSKATESIQQTQNGVSVDVKADYQFYQEKSVNKFTANGTVNMSVTASSTTYSSACSGALTGVKQ